MTLRTLTFAALLASTALAGSAFAQNNTSGSTNTTGAGTTTADPNAVPVVPAQPGAQSQTDTQGTVGADGQVIPPAQDAQTTPPADPAAPATGTADSTTGTDMNANQATGSTQPMTTETILQQNSLSGAKVISANDMLGKRVYSQAGEDLGEVNDFFVSEDGMVRAVVVGVGGFLGIGEKDVALNMNAIQVQQDGSSVRLVVNATKEALNAAPSFDVKTNSFIVPDGSTTTGTGTGNTTGSGSTTSQ